ncbi:MAG: T9SS type A sorting domain-containing protein [bacterium]|nr:T9SS type A sorting domain-containing protein [bacterium]
MSKIKKVSCLIAAFAFLTVAVMVGGAEADVLADKKVFVDLTRQSGADDTKVNDALKTKRPPVAGDTLRIELFVQDAAGVGTIGFEGKFAQANATFLTKWTILPTLGVGGMGPISAPTATTTGYGVGALSASTIPASGYIGTLVLLAKANIAEGDSLKLTGVSIGLASFNQDNLDVSEAKITFATPPGPSLATSSSVADMPAHGAGPSPDVTVTASNFADGAEINWVVTTAGEATVDVLVAGSMMSNMMFPSTSTTIALHGTGPGDATADVYAYVGTDTTNTVRITFTSANPAELAAFGGELVDNKVVLNWTTASQTNNAGWRMLRSVDGENYVAVSDFIQGAGTSDALLNYSFADAGLPSVDQVFYVLEQVDLDGSVTRSSAIEVVLGARHELPTEFSANVYPNPFNPSTTISYDLPSDALVSIVIYDALGQEVRRLESKQVVAGRYTIQWDARDNQNRNVSSGVYIAKIEAGVFSHSQKMLFLK